MDKKLSEQIIEMRNIDQDLRTQAPKNDATKAIDTYLVPEKAVISAIGPVNFLS